MNQEQMNHERAKVFLEKGLKVHVTKVDGIFFNGLITEVSEKFFFIEDIEDGRQLVFFNELSKPIEEYREKEVKEWYGQ